MVVDLAPVRKLRPPTVRLARRKSHRFGAGALIESSLSAGGQVHQLRPRAGPVNVVETGNLGLVGAGSFGKLAAGGLGPPSCDRSDMAQQISISNGRTQKLGRRIEPG